MTRLHIVLWHAVIVWCIATATITTNNHIVRKSPGQPLDGDEFREVVGLCLSPYHHKQLCDTTYVDIRNDPTKAAKNIPRNYQNCTVLEGSFGINILLPTANSNWTQRDDAFDGVRFENLVEITGHLRVYKTIQLQTLRHILPKLRVIRLVIIAPT